MYHKGGRLWPWEFRVLVVLEMRSLILEVGFTSEKYSRTLLLTATGGGIPTSWTDTSIWPHQYSSSVAPPWTYQVREAGK